MIPLNAELMIAAAVLVLLLVLMTLRRRRARSGASDNTADDAADEVATEARSRRFMKKGKAKADDSDEDVATTGTISAVAVAEMAGPAAEATEAPAVDAHEVEAPTPIAVVADQEVDEAEVPVAEATDVHEPAHDAPEAVAGHEDEAPDTHVDAPVIAPVAAHAGVPASEHDNHNVHEGDVADLFFGHPYDHAADEPDWDAMRHPAPVAAAAAFSVAPPQDTTVMATVPAAAPAITDDALITRPGWPLPGDLEAWESADMADMTNHPSDDDLSHWAEAAAARADNGAGFPPHDAGTAPGVHLSNPDHLGGPDAPAPGMPAAPTIGDAHGVPPASGPGPMTPGQLSSAGNPDPMFWDIGNQAPQPAETWPPTPQPAETNQWTTPNNVAAPGDGMPEPTRAPATATPQTPSADDWWTSAPAAPAAAAPIHEPDPATSGLQRPAVDAAPADTEWWGAPAAAPAEAVAANDTWWVAPPPPAVPAAPIEPSYPGASTPSAPVVAIPVSPAPSLGETAIPVPPAAPPEPAPVAETPAPLPPRYTIPDATPVAEPAAPVAEPQVVEQHVPPVAPPPVIAVTTAPVAPAAALPTPEAVAAPAAAPAPVVDAAIPASVPPAARVLPRLDAGAKNPPANGRFAVGGTAVAPGDGAFTRVRFRVPLSRPIIGWGIGDEPDYAPGTLVLVVDAVLNCSADGLAVLQDDGDPNRPEGFTLSLSSHAPGPFAVSGTYHVVSD